MGLGTAGKIAIGLGAAGLALWGIVLIWPKTAAAAAPPKTGGPGADGADPEIKPDANQHIVLAQGYMGHIIVAGQKFDKTAWMPDHSLNVYAPSGATIKSVSSTNEKVVKSFSAQSAAGTMATSFDALAEGETTLTFTLGGNLAGQTASFKIITN